VRLALAAGETSGDLLGAAVAGQLLQRDRHLELFGLVGPQMRAAGVEALATIDELGVMGLFEVLRHVPRLASLRRRVRMDMLARQADAFIGFDAPDFNLGLARALRRRGVPTVQVVAPTVWAWRGYRKRKVAGSLDLLLTLFPFEPECFAGCGLDVRYIGHPLADAMPLSPDRAAARARLGLSAEDARPVVALLPGSRHGEIDRHAGLLVETVTELRRQADIRPLLLLAETGHVQRFKRAAGISAADAGLEVRTGSTRDGLAAASVALAASGTVTLEALLSHTPMVVFYRLPAATYQLARRLVRSRWVALPNILAGRDWVPERIQQQASAARLAADALDWLANDERRREFSEAAVAIHRQLACNAAGKAATAILELTGRRGR